MNKIKYGFLFGGIILIASGLVLINSNINNTTRNGAENSGSKQTNNQTEEKDKNVEEQDEKETNNETQEKIDNQENEENKEDNKEENKENKETQDQPTESKTPDQETTPETPPKPKESVIPDGNLIEAYFLNTINNKNFKVTSSYGNNDAFIFKTYNNKYILLDTGVTYSNQNVPATEIIDLIYNKLKSLQNKNVVTIDYMIVSHMHWDHAGNAPTILTDSRFDIKNIIFKREKIQPLDEKIYEAAVKNGKTNIIETNNKLQEGSYYTLDDNIKMYLFNVKDVFANAYECQGEMPYYNYLIDIFKDYNAVRYGLLTNENKYMYYLGSELFANEGSAKYHVREGKPTTNEINHDNIYDNIFWIIKQENGYNCNANTNSIVVVFQVKTQKGNKYIYLPADLENNGYEPFGEYDSKLKTTIHGGVATYPYLFKESNGYPFAMFDINNKFEIDTFYKIYKIPAEYTVAKQVVDKFGDIKGNITIYQESHHGLNNSPEALNMLGVNNKSTYAITPSETDPRTSYQYRVLRGQYYLSKSNIMYNGGADKQGIKCTIDGLGTTACSKY